MSNKNFQNGFVLGFALRDHGYTADYVKINKYSTMLRQMFYQAVLPEELTLDISDANITSLQSFMQTSTSRADIKKITIVGDTSQVTTFSYAFYNRTALTDIDGLIDFTSATDMGNMFFGSGIVNARFSPNTLKVDFNISTVTTLSDDTLISIANCLSNTTKATLSLSATSYNKCAAIYGIVDDDMFFTRTDNTSDINLVDFISDAAYKGWQLSH